jgi:excisionase family DNA binding protein
LFDEWETAAVLKVSVQKVRKLLREGLLRGVKIGRSRRYSRAAVAAYLQSIGAEPPALWLKEEAADAR